MRAKYGRIALARSWRYQSRWALAGRWGTYGLRTGKYRRYRRYRHENGIVEMWAG